VKRQLFAAVSLMVVVSVLLALPPGSVTSMIAQEPHLPTFAPAEPAPSSSDGPWETALNGRKYMPADAPARASFALAPQSTGGPDEYGYTWNDSVAFSWIDAVAGGTDTGMSGYAAATGPIALPFSFKYYENIYTSLYIAAPGYVSFDNSDYWSTQDEIPAPSTPNNVIAPYWTPTYLKSTGPTGRVYYKSGGTAPNRYFVVEWYDVKGGDSSDTIGKDDTYRFEAVLYENGDIVFQYHTMTLKNDYWCGASGIEDPTGMVGLSYVGFCNYPPSNRAVRFYRPAPAARVNVTPLSYGQFVRADQTAVFQIPIRNTGELGADTYDLFVTSSWPVSLYSWDGTTLLTDTDGDFTIDTGPVVQGGTFVVVAKVQTPGTASLGDNNTAYLTVQSSLNTSKSKNPVLQSAVPAPFAQVFNDNTDGAMSLYLAQPAGQTLEKVTEDGHYGYYLAVAELPNSNFAYAWTMYRSLGNVGVREIEYTLVDRFGKPVHAVSNLTNHSGATVYTYDYYPAIAVAPNGRIGVLWYRYLYNNANSQFNYNIYFAILDASGSVAYGPVSVTNNSTWGTSSAQNVPRFYEPRITATTDNRFVLAWRKYYYGAPTGSCTSYCSVSDIFYAARDSNGNQVKAPTAFTHDTAGSADYYFDPTLTALSGNRALLAFSRSASYQDIYYGVLDSSGNTVMGMTNLSSDGNSQYDYGPDAVQLSDGRVAVAWTGGSYPYYQIRFAILDTAYNRSAGPTTLNNSAAVAGNDYVSVSADASGRAILTWSDYDTQRNLYYALVDGNGTQITPPMIFHASQADYLGISSEGYGNTSYSWTPPSGVDGKLTLGSALVGATPGGAANMAVTYLNHGAAIATNVVLTATLDSNLTYLSDTSGIAPSISGNDITWNLPDMGLYDGGGFMLRLNVPSAAIGTRYPVTFTLTASGSEANSTDNTGSGEVMIAYQVYLPLIRR
jgi:uncharacterized repeat protein (TIGR01451 family)